MIPIPETLPTLVGLDDRRAAAVEHVLKGCPVPEALNALGTFWPIKVWFKEPVPIQLNRRHARPVTEHVFRKFFFSKDLLCYSPSTRGRHGFPFPDDKMVRYEPVVISNSFKSYEQFKARFNLRFISESEIKKLFNETSAQTGEKYRPTDFKPLGPSAKLTMERFLKRFKSVDDTEGADYGTYGVQELRVPYLQENHKSNGPGGRDIEIAHRLGQPLVHYSSEYPGCGNGDYGLIATERTFLYLEKD